MHEETSSAFIAVSLAMTGSVFTSTSFILMKYAHNRLQASDNKNEVSAFKAIKDPYWAFAFLLILLSSFFNVYALKFGSQILISCTSSLTIIINTILSVSFLKERLHLSDLYAIILICFGSTLFTISAKNVEKPLNP